MLIIGYQDRQKQIDLLVTLPVSANLVRSASLHSIKLITINLAIGLCLAYALHKGASRVRGFSKVVLELLAGLSSFYIFLDS
jgi:hypothetical protein